MPAFHFCLTAFFRSHHSLQVFCLGSGTTVHVGITGTKFSHVSCLPVNCHTNNTISYLGIWLCIVIFMNDLFLLYIVVDMFDC